MAPLQRLAFLALRCLRLALDTLADVTLFYVFVVGTLSGADAIADVYSATATPPPQHALAVAVAALCYGSQHLRFNGERLLGLGLGAALAGLARQAGDLRATFVAAALFAILRYLNRTHDVRRFHGA